MLDVEETVSGVGLISSLAYFASACFRSSDSARRRTAVCVGFIWASRDICGRFDAIELNWAAHGAARRAVRKLGAVRTAGAGKVFSARRDAPVRNMMTSQTSFLWKLAEP